MRRLCLALLLAASFSACVPSARIDDDAAARKAEITIRSLMAARERGDVTLVEDLFWPEATYDDFPNQHTYQGFQEIMGYVTALHAWADDVYWSVGAVHITETGAIAEWIFSATQARPIGTQVPVAMGREVMTNGVTLIQIENGRIVRAADYMDTTPMMLQLGGRLQMPGGSVITLEDGR